jgi:alginate O-acetyltransferase complex protein AlgJ
VSIDSSAAPRLAPSTGRSDSPHRLPRRPVAFLLALAFFFAPFFAYVAGSRAGAIENRDLTPFPSLSEGWDFFPQLTAWATDHLPLRQVAVEGNAAFSERVFGEAPTYRTDTGGGVTAGVPSGDAPAQDGPEYPQIIEGQDGWLYFGQDAASLCQPVQSIDETMARLDRLAAAVEASGRTFVMTVAPDKSTVYPDELPDTYLGQECSTERRSEFWDRLRSDAPAGYFDIRGPLEAEQVTSGTSVYRATDSHWSPSGSAVYAMTLAARLDPSIPLTTQRVDSGTVSLPGDLAALIGRPQDDVVGDVQLIRPGVEPVGRDGLDLPEMPYAPETFTNTTADAPLYQPATLLLGDSFSTAARSALGAVFADVTLLHNEVAGSYPEAVAEQFVDADTVVYEIVERTIGAGGGALITDASLDAIETALAANPR